MERALLTATLLAGTLVCSLVLAQQTSNYELRLVPAPGPVSIDGDLGDWDRSGGIFMCYDVATMGDTHSVRVWGMHDPEALYLAFHFKDRTPMVNRIDPDLEPFSGWRSDAVQVRLWTNEVLHVDAYYFTDEQRPVMQIIYKDMAQRDSPEHKILDALAEGAELAFRTDPGGQGYVQEMKLPWRFLRRDGHVYRAGESFRMGLECFWGDVTGRNWPQHRLVDLLNRELAQREFFWSNKQAWGQARLLEQGQLPPTVEIVEPTPAERLAELRTRTEGPVPLEYDLPADGFVTLVIEDAQGNSIRNLISNAPRRAGRNLDRWDGASDEGKLVEPGEYRFRGLYHQGLDVAYQFHFANPGDPPWDTGDGTGNWLADHANAQAAAADDEAIYVASPNAEAGTCVMRLSPEGRKEWGVIRVMPGESTAMAVDDQFVYVALERRHHWLSQAKEGEAETLIYKVDKRTGRFAGWPDNQRERIVSVWPRSRVPEVQPSMGSAQWAQREDMSLPELRRAGRVHPGALRHQLFGMAVDTDHVYLSQYWNDEILVLDKQSGETLRRLSVRRPAGLAMTAERQLLAVSRREVVAVDSQTGETENVIASRHLQAPVGLTVDGQGRLYVSDWAGAMQVKVFSPAGEPLRTVGKTGGRPWVGDYDTGGMLLPRGLAVDARGRLWVAEDDVSPKRISVWRGDGRFETEFLGPPGYGGMYGCINPYRPTQAFNYGVEYDLDWRRGAGRTVRTLWRQMYDDALFGIEPYDRIWVVRSGGKEYLLADNTTNKFVMSIRDGDHYRPLMAAGYGLPDMPFLPEHGELDNFVWSDHNGDGRVQPEEIQIFPAPGVDQPLRWYSGWTWAVDQDLTIYPVSSGNTTYIWRMPVQGWTPAGAPIYDGPGAELMVKQPVAHFSNSVKCDPQGRIIANQKPLTLYSPEGEILWTYPNNWPGVHGSHRAPQAQPGRLIGPLYVIGDGSLEHGLGSVFAMIGNLGQIFLMTTEGLYVGELFQDARSAPESPPSQLERGMSLTKTSCGAEPFGGFFFRHPADGRHYVVQGHSAAVVHEVKGLDTLRPLAGEECSFSPEQYEEAVELLARRVAEAEEAQAVQVLRAETPPQINADTGDWGLAPESFVDFSFDPAHTCRAAARYDDENLYLLWQVRDDSPWQNGTQDPTLAFKGGDCVLFELGTDAQADPRRGQAVRGDLRLLIAPHEGRPQVVLYDYVHPGSELAATFSSPWQHTRVDRVEILEQAEVAVRTQADSYIVEARVPLAALGWSPQAGQSYRGDFGVIYSDPEGKVNVLRMYWANQAAGIVSDIGIEARVQPNLWGVLKVE